MVQPPLPNRPLGKSVWGNFTNGDERDHLGVIVLTSYDVYLLGQVTNRLIATLFALFLAAFRCIHVIWQAYFYYEVDPDCYVTVCYGASCSQVNKAGLLRLCVLGLQ